MKHSMIKNIYTNIDKKINNLDTKYIINSIWKPKKKNVNKAEERKDDFKVKTLTS